MSMKLRTSEDSMSILRSNNHNDVSKEYLNIPTMVFRQGEWINIAEHNLKKNRKHRLPKTHKLVSNIAK